MAEEGRGGLGEHSIKPESKELTPAAWMSGEGEKPVVTSGKQKPTSGLFAQSFQGVSNRSSVLLPLISPVTADTEAMPVYPRLVNSLATSPKISQILHRYSSSSSMSISSRILPLLRDKKITKTKPNSTCSEMQHQLTF